MAGGSRVVGGCGVIGRGGWSVVCARVLRVCECAQEGRGERDVEGVEEKRGGGGLR